MKKVLMFTVILFFGHEGYTQLNNKVKRTKQLEIETSIQCGECENRLDNMFAEFWAVKNVSYDIDEQLITVTYNSNKTSPEEIRDAIAKVGYDADDVEAKEAAYNELPACCQKGGHHPE